MSDRVTGRHRASLRPSTPLSTLISTTQSAVSDHVGAIGRGGAVIAMSSGLVASMGLPANAVSVAPADAAGPRTASMPVLPATAVTGSFLALPADLDDDAPVTASLAATVSFDGGAFRAVPKPAAAAPARIARSSTRTALAPTTTHRSTQHTTTTHTTVHKSAPVKTTPTGGGFGSARGSSVVAIASRYLGRSYVYGGSSPSTGFDCSGLVQWVFSQLGVRVPRTAQQQYDAATHLSRSQARAGDLVFFGSPNGVFHVGIYLGGNMMIDAPHTGTVVQRRAIWSSAVSFGRL